MANCRQICRKCVAPFLLILGIVLVILGTAGVYEFPALINEQVTQNVILKEGTVSYKMWKEPTVPIYMTFYVFNVTNPDQVLAGGKPRVKELGPYAYREYRHKVNITFNGNGTVSYRQIRTFHFDRDKSVGDDSDNFTSPNIPLLTVAEAMNSQNALIKLAVEAGLKVTDEKLFVTRSVREIIWGYHDPLMHMMTLLPGLHDWFYTDWIGVMMNKNATDDGLYTVYTGEDDIGKVGMIDKYNGAKYLNFWTSDYANMVNGSDGTVAPPSFAVKNDSMSYTFQSDICRTVYGLKNGTVDTPQGITLHRYVGPASELANYTVNPDNIGFCVPRNNCLGTGLLWLKSCTQVDYFPVPVIASFPHFYLGDPKFVKAIDGIHPNATIHNTEVDIEPITGLTLKAHKRVQINVYMDRVAGISQTGNISELFFPILWLDESVEIDDATADMFKNLVYFPITATQVIQWALIGIGVALVLISLIIALVRYKKWREAQSSSEGYKRVHTENT